MTGMVFPPTIAVLLETVAAVVSTKDVALVTELTFEPAGMPVPNTIIPGASPAVLAQVTVGLVFKVTLVSVTVLRGRAIKV